MTVASAIVTMALAVMLLPLLMLSAAQAIPPEDILAEEEADVQSVHWLTEKGSVKKIPEAAFEGLEVFCHPGQDISVVKFWTTSTLRLQLESDSFHVFTGRNASEVTKAYMEHQNRWLAPSSSVWQTRDVRLNPFSKSCVGVLTQERYNVLLQMYRVNYWLVVMTAAGLALYFLAPQLCRNVFFHYATGIGAGVGLSLLVVTYFLQKKMRASWMGWFMGLYSVSLYFLTTLWYNMKNYLVENQAYLVGYLLVTGGISFAVCYRMGPVENPRTLNLIQWSLQLFALILIYLSSYHQAASLAVAVAVVTWSAVPDKAKANFRTWYRKKFFKPKIKLLTEAEYMDQSRVETERQLEELRKFCASPKCDAWKLTSSLKSPSRFAEFVQGSPHLTQREVMEYSHHDEDDVAGDFSDDNDDVDNEDTDGNGRAGGGAAYLLTDDENSDNEVP